MEKGVNINILQMFPARVFSKYVCCFFVSLCYVAQTSSEDVVKKWVKECVWMSWWKQQSAH